MDMIYQDLKKLEGPYGIKCLKIPKLKTQKASAIHCGIFIVAKGQLNLF